MPKDDTLKVGEFKVKKIGSLGYSILVIDFNLKKSQRILYSCLDYLFANYFKY